MPYQRRGRWSRTQTAAGGKLEDSREKRQQGEQSHQEDVLPAQTITGVALNQRFFSFMSLALQLEVVALLFSDVLLMTKIHKKGERLKVVRPPLALDRTHCIALKDGCGSQFPDTPHEKSQKADDQIACFSFPGSFTLIEVGELQSAMNVYIFVASTSESCFRWVTTIQQAKVETSLGDLYFPLLQ